jgi:two-component system, NtrC family, nitrogen regulation sensor histidine kinase GlnL
MTAQPATLAALPASLPPAEKLLEALPLPLLLLDPENRIRRANAAAEAFFRQSLAQLDGRPLADLVGADGALLALVDQARGLAAPVSEHDLAVAGPRLPRREVRVDAAPLADRPDWVLVALGERALGGELERQRRQQDAVRPLNAVAATLAHEVKNPLSGIRGAAQLIERDLPPEGRELARLIRDEADRIRALVDRMEAFADPGFAVALAPVNIHEVLDHVRRVAEAGFAAERRILVDFDPSLPPAAGHRDLLVQLFLNLVKNAAEATEPGRGAITLATRYRHGAKLAGAGGAKAAHLPLAVTVADNGPGIPEALRPRIFDPFVSGKPGGSGLGLALAAKIAADHGGAIDCASEPGRTRFTVLLALAEPEPA